MAQKKAFRVLLSDNTFVGKVNDRSFGFSTPKVYRPVQG
jgi:hypothetical protein